MTMDAIHLEASDDTPSINLDVLDNKFEIAGRSLPENTLEFYQPVIDWLTEYARRPNYYTIFSFKLSYFSSASSRAFFDIIMILKDIHASGKSKVEVNWHYMENDDDTRDAGLDFERAIGIPFKHLLFHDRTMP